MSDVRDRLAEKYAIDELGRVIGTKWYAYTAGWDECAKRAEKLAEALGAIIECQTDHPDKDKAPLIIAREALRLYRRDFPK